LEFEEQPGESTAGLPAAGPPSAVVTDQYNNEVPNVLVEGAGRTITANDGSISGTSNEFDVQAAD